MQCPGPEFVLIGAADLDFVDLLDIQDIEKQMT